MTKHKRRKKRQTHIVNFVLAAIAVICVIFIVTKVFGENDTVAEQNSLFNVDEPGQTAIIVNGELSELQGIEADGRFYIPYETVWNDINSGFYVESATDTLFMTLPSQTYTWTAGDESGYLYKDSDGTYYISTDCISEYTDIEINTFSEPDRIVMRNEWDGLYYADVTENSPIRLEPSGYSEIAVRCSAGDTLEFFSDDGEWSRVMSQDGHIGYIRSDCIGEAEAAPEHTASDELIFAPVSSGETISMAWDYIGRAEDNALLGNMMEGVSGLNVISPTWFTLADASGNIASFADAAYVQTAHETYGLEVWALLGDYAGEDTSTGAILSTYDNRQRCISSLMQNILTYGIDGINIDFEDIDDEYGPAYIEFLRELTQQAHANGIVVSVDNYVPGYTEQYRRDAQNDIVDYVIMMGYDEHTAYTAEYGSVASLPYVEEGVVATLEEVDAEKLVLGVPFYTRGWTVPFGTDVFESETLFMSDQEEFISSHGIELVWDESVSQYTGSAEDDTARYFIWVENADSLTAKLSLLEKYGLAGAAGWRLGMQTNDIWAAWQSALG